MNGNNIDILITGGNLLTMSDSMEVVENPVIGIRDGKILFVDTGYDPQSNPYNAGEVIDAAESIIMPGLINTHTHLPMTCFRGLADDIPLKDWLDGIGLKINEVCSKSFAFCIIFMPLIGNRHFFI